MSTKEYLASVQVQTAAQLLFARTTDVADAYPDWRKKKGMRPLQGYSSALVSVLVWKRKVRLNAALVGDINL